MWKILGACPVNLVKFSHLMYIYICSYTKTPTVNWYRGLYTSIYIVCVHAFYQGLVWCSHCSLLWTYAMRTLKYTCARLRKFETHKYYSTWAIVLLPCHTQALTVCSKRKMQAPCTHVCKLRRELCHIIILCILIHNQNFQLIFNETVLWKS